MLVVGGVERLHARQRVLVIAELGYRLAGRDDCLFIHVNVSPVPEGARASPVRVAELQSCECPAGPSGSFGRRRPAGGTRICYPTCRGAQAPRPAGNPTAGLTPIAPDGVAVRC